MAEDRTKAGGTPIVRYSDVEITRNELIVLRHVDLCIGQGEFVYLIGRVGSGKSSLLKTMYAEIPVSSGSAEVLGYDIASIRRKQIPFLRREMGIVFQDFQLLTDRDVRHNLLFVLKATGWKDKNEIEERIRRVLSIVGMENKSYKMPHELSGGEQQRVAIARALLNDPRLILADEPTGNLDPETARGVLDTLHNISRSGTAVVMATHNLGFVRDFPGRVINVGNKKAEETKTTSSGETANGKS